MKKLYKAELSSRLKAYSSMALALTAGSTALNAEIVYNDIADETIEVDGLFNLDVDGDGSIDFQFTAGLTLSSTSSGVWSFGSVFGYVTSYSVGNAGNQLIGYAGSFYNYGSALDSGANIGPDGPWLSYPSYGNSAVLASNFYGTTYGAFPGQGEKFLGFKFSAGGNNHYGWMRITADVDPVTIIIHDYAYDNTPDAAIEAGATISIAVTELPEGAVSIYSFGNMINVMNTIGLENATATVFDLSGKQISTINIVAGLNQIELDNVATGNYLIQIASNQGNTSKQIFIN